MDEKTPNPLVRLQNGSVWKEQAVRHIMRALFGELFWEDKPLLKQLIRAALDKTPPQFPPEMFNDLKKMHLIDSDGNFTYITVDVIASVFWFEPDGTLHWRGKFYQEAGSDAT